MKVQLVKKYFVLVMLWSFEWQKWFCNGNRRLINIHTQIHWGRGSSDIQETTDPGYWVNRCQTIILEVSFVLVWN